MASPDALSERPGRDPGAPESHILASLAGRRQAAAAGGDGGEEWPRVGLPEGGGRYAAHARRSRPEPPTVAECSPRASRGVGAELVAGEVQHEAAVPGAVGLLQPVALEHTLRSRSEDAL